MQPSMGVISYSHLITSVPSNCISKMGLLNWVLTSKMANVVNKPPVNIKKYIQLGGMVLVFL